MPDDLSAIRRSAPVPRRERTGLLALAVPNLEEPYFAELTALIVRRAGERGLAILIQQTEGDHDREVDVANGVGLPETDGLIHIPRALTVGDLTRRQSPGPLVLLGEHIQVSPFTHVTIDNKRAARIATEHLAHVGCERIAFIGRRDVSPSDASDQRFAGYLEGVAASSLTQDPALEVQVSAFTSEEGQRGARALLASGAAFDGVVCSNDSVAFGVLSALALAGVRVPDDAAVIGIDDVRGARFSTPALTSVSPDREALVDAALTELERQVSAPPGAEPPISHVVVGAKVIARASSAR